MSQAEILCLRTGCISSLMDLPLEIIQGVNNAAVEIIGRDKLPRLRLINSA